MHGWCSHLSKQTSGENISGCTCSAKRTPGQQNWKPFVNSGTPQRWLQPMENANKWRSTGRRSRSWSFRDGAVTRRHSYRLVIRQTLRRARFFRWVGQWSKTTSDLEWVPCFRTSADQVQTRSRDTHEQLTQERHISVQLWLCSSRQHVCMYVCMCNVYVYLCTLPQKTYAELIPAKKL